MVNLFFTNEIYDFILSNHVLKICNKISRMYTEYGIQYFIWIFSSEYVTIMGIINFVQSRKFNVKSFWNTLRI